MSAPFFLKAKQYERAIAYRNTWKRWHAIQKRIVSHPDYHFRARYRITLLRLAEFAQTEMSHANTQYWRIVNEL